MLGRPPRSWPRSRRRRRSGRGRTRGRSAPVAPCGPAHPSRPGPAWPGSDGRPPARRHRQTWVRSAATDHRPAPRQVAPRSSTPRYPTRQLEPRSCRRGRSVPRWGRYRCRCRPRISSRPLSRIRSPHGPRPHSAARLSGAGIRVAEPSGSRIRLRGKGRKDPLLRCGRGVAGRPGCRRLAAGREQHAVRPAAPSSSCRPGEHPTCADGTQTLPYHSPSGPHFREGSRSTGMHRGRSCVTPVKAVGMLSARTWI